MAAALVMVQATQHLLFLKIKTAAERVCRQTHHQRRLELAVEPALPLLRTRLPRQALPSKQVPFLTFQSIVQNRKASTGPSNFDPEPKAPLRELVHPFPPLLPLLLEAVFSTIEPSQSLICLNLQLEPRLRNQNHESQMLSKSES